MKIATAISLLLLVTLAASASDYAPDNAANRILADRLAQSYTQAAQQDCENCAEFEALESVVQSLTASLDVLYTCLSGKALHTTVAHPYQMPPVQVDPPVHQEMPPSPRNPKNVPLNVADEKFYIAACEEDPTCEVCCNPYSRAFELDSLLALQEANAKGITLVLPAPKKSEKLGDYAVGDPFTLRGVIPATRQQLNLILEERAQAAKAAAMVKALADSAAAAALAAGATPEQAQKASVAAVQKATNEKEQKDAANVPRFGQAGAKFTFNNRKMYFMNIETPEQIECTADNGNCISNWPVVPCSAIKDESVTATLNARKITRPDGICQLVLNNRAVYIFKNDKSLGDELGIAFSGGVFELFTAN